MREYHYIPLHRERHQRGLGLRQLPQGQVYAQREEPHLRHSPLVVRTNVIGLIKAHINFLEESILKKAFNNL